MSKITIEYEKCEGADCGECVDFCPMEILVMDDDKIIVKNPENCSLCEVCMDVCPNEAIKVEE